MYRMATVSENLQDIQTLQTNTNSHETSDDDPPESKRKKLEDETKSSSQIVQPAKIQHISDDEESDDGAFCTVVSLLASLALRGTWRRVLGAERRNGGIFRSLI